MKRKLTLEDMHNNPILKQMGLVPGDEIDIPNQTEADDDDTGGSNPPPDKERPGQP